ncbi:MAG: hypothetical protein M1818_005319 [Claussenomyces sp. TS43310]|nr:MAG: hypothetical protein M1818_005319 [Claussenomyces sp. TS43310]
MDSAMLTVFVEQLVASSTVGVAAAGLVFGRTEAHPPERPTSKKRKVTEYENGRRHTPSPSRPVTSSNMRTPIREQALNSSPWSDAVAGILHQHGIGDRDVVDGAAGQLEPSHLGPRGRRVRRETLPSQSLAVEERMGSVSSRGSWIKRLSAIQPSQESGSPRSSVGPESPSLNISHGSGAPILHSSSPAQLPPNKLVKRSTSGRLADVDFFPKNGSRSIMPSLRRPATSYQRSVTLQQQFLQHEQEVIEAAPQHHSSPARLTQYAEEPSFSDARAYWRPHFEAHSVKVNKDRLSDIIIDGSGQEFFQSSKRVLLPEDSILPTLLKPEMVVCSRSDDSFVAVDFGPDDSALFSDSPYTPKSSSAERDLHKRPKHSISMHFNSPTTWITRSSSLRAAKRAVNMGNAGKRNASAPLSSLPGRNIATSYSPRQSQMRAAITDPTIYQKQPADTQDDGASRLFLGSSHSRPRNASSPLPPLSRLSSFNLDLGHKALSSSTSSDAQQASSSPIYHGSTPSSPQMGTKRRSHGKSSPTVVVHQSRNPRVTSMAASDHASTLIGSDNENRDFASGEEDETDFQSDTVFDSFRTGHTGSMRVRTPALESMFDNSPMNTYNKAKGLTIDDLVTNIAFNDRTDRIMEEDEGMSTPIKSRRASAEELFSTPTRLAAESDDAIRSSPPSFCLATTNFGHLSLEDDEEDEDWARDDDSIGLSNSLSPPSASIHPPAFNPAIRMALADLTKNRLSPGHTVPHGDRPKSVFDWSEPLMADKTDALGNSPRPRTVHGKQAVDGRGGRAIGRRGPSALHIRSQSVPVVPDANGHREHTKMAPKFGTWGLGAKGVSEDWDNDFEFDGIDVDEDENGIKSMSSSMLVPPSIQASQANVVGHVGQIREVCLLVEDLKRLRGLAKEKEILDGASAGLWREAEGIIALAIPDEDDITLSSSQSPSPRSPDSESGHGKNFDARFHKNDSLKSVLDENVVESRTTNDHIHGRRRSVFSPEDDIFGAWPPAEAEEERLRSTSELRFSNKQATNVARSVMEHIHQHRVASDPLLSGKPAGPSSKMPFDTTSLRDLVQRASTLTRMLAEIIRRADNPDQSPHRSPRHERDRDSSPAFTRVFTDPLASPPKNLPRSQSNNSILSGSIDSSPSRSLGQRLHMMTVV